MKARTFYPDSRLIYCLIRYFVTLGHNELEAKNKTIDWLRWEYHNYGKI